MIKNINAVQAQQLLTTTDTFIINIVASWCSDCTDQAENTPNFAQHFTNMNIPFYQLNVQDIKNEFISEVHHQTTESLGGHGYPRTVLINKGKISDADNVEVITSESLKQLTEKFMTKLPN